MEGLANESFERKMYIVKVGEGPSREILKEKVFKL